MKKPPTAKTPPKHTHGATTTLSSGKPDSTESNTAQDTADTGTGKSSVKSPELAELCSIFGNENGMKLYQGNVDIDEVKQWKTLNDKFSKYLAASTSDDDKDDEKTEDTADQDESDNSDKDEEKEQTTLSAQLLAKLHAMTKTLESQTADILKLKAQASSTDPVSHGNVPPKKTAKNSIAAYAAKYK